MFLFLARLKLSTNLLQALVIGQQSADLVFGGVTILSGIVGTLCGGLFMDYLGSTLRNLFKVRIVNLGLTQILEKFDLSLERSELIKLCVHLLTIQSCLTSSC